jgi:hypothetical protein
MVKTKRKSDAVDNDLRIFEKELKKCDVNAIHTSFMLGTSSTTMTDEQYNKRNDLERRFIKECVCKRYQSPGIVNSRKKSKEDIDFENAAMEHYGKKPEDLTNSEFYELDARQKDKRRK